MTNVSGGDAHHRLAHHKGRENAGYGGLFWRGPRSFTNGTVQSPDGIGADNLRGTRAQWFAFRGKHDETGRSHPPSCMVDDTANPQHPPQWFTRSEEFACLNPAPFFSEEVEFDARRAHCASATRVAWPRRRGDGPLADAGRRRALRGPVGRRSVPA